MKKTVFSYLVCAFALVSCSKDVNQVSTSKEIPVASTPTKITTFVSQNYPDASISTVFKYLNSDTTYTVTLNTYEFLAFNHSQDFMGEAMADTLIDPRPDGDSIPGGHHGGEHHGCGRHGGGHHGGGPHGIGIPYDSIPAGIKSYVSNNYAGYTIHHANYETFCQFGNLIEVMIDSSYKAHQELLFDLSGTFKALTLRVQSTDLPSSVTTAVTNIYSTYSLSDKVELFALADGSKQYKVFLNKDKDRKSVVFKEDGTVICEQ